MYHSVSDFLFILERKRKLLCTLSLAVAKWIKKTPNLAGFIYVTQSRLSHYTPKSNL